MAVVAVTTFLRDTKGIVGIPVDLGGETPVAIILLTNRHDPANGTAGTAYSSVDGPEYGIGFGTIATEIMNKMIIQDANSVQSSNTWMENTRIYWTGSTFSQDWDVNINSFSADEVELNFVNVPISLSHEQQFTMIVFGGSDCLAHVTEVNLGTGTSAIDVTAPGFEPDIVFAAHAARSATGVSSSGAAFGLFTMGVGLNDGSDTQRCIGRRDGSGTLTVNRSNFTMLDRAIAVFLNGGTSPTNGAEIVIGSYDASGFSVTPSANSTSILLATLALQTPGIVFSLDDFLTKTSTGIQGYTGIGFEPDVLLLLGGGSTTINTPSGPNAANATSYMSVQEKLGDAGMYLLLSQDNVDPSNSLNYCNSDGSLLSLGSTAVDNLLAAEISSFDSDGFSINYTTAPGTAYLFMGLSMRNGGLGGSGVYVDSRFFF